MSVKIRASIGEGPICVKGVESHLVDLSTLYRNQWVSSDTERIGRTGWSRIYHSRI